MWKILDGKKTWLGILLAAWPGIIEAISKAVAVNGADLDTAKLITWLGSSGVLLIVGVAHKLIKTWER